MSSHSNEILQTRVKSPRPVRERHPTEKTMLCLLQKEGKLRQRFNRAWQNLPTIADAIRASLCPKEKEILRQEFVKAFNNGSAIAEEIIYVLNKINTPESLDRAKEISFSLQEERRRYSAVLFEPEPSSLFKGAEERVQGSPCVSLRSSLLKIPSNDASLKSKHSSRHSSSSQSTHSFISTSSKAAHYNREAVRLKIRKEVLEAEASAEMARQDFAFNEEELLLQQAKAKQKLLLAQARAQQEADLAQARAQREIELAMAEAKQDELQRDLDLLQVKRDTAQKIVRANVLAKALSQELTQENLSFLPTQEPTAKVSAHLQLAPPVVQSHISFCHLEDRSPVPVFLTSRPAHSSEVQQSTAGRVPSLSESIPALRPQRYHLSTWERMDDVFQQHPDVHPHWQGMAGSEPPHSSLHTKSILPSLKMKASEVLPASNLLNPASPTIAKRCVQPKNIEFVTPHHTPQMYPYTLESQLGSLLRNPRRDIRDKGVQKFTDRPDDYLLWKITFMRAIRDFKLEADEELSLLMAWLGPSSAEQVKRLYAAHVADPQRALSTAWSRLDQRFGASTEIEASLMDRLNRFPSLKMKDCKQLWDFSDLLLELASAKGNPELPGLACLDQHTSQSAILCKLPFPLREAWGKQVFKYKEENANVYPPFTFLVDFVTRAARERNDPQTGLLALYQDLKPEKTSKEDKAQGKDLRRNLSVKMTDATPATSAQPVSNNTISCPIHQGPHSLAECREFAKKPYKERLQIVQKAKVCFRCCGATIHFSKDCKEKVKCQHCNSIKHCSAMHNFDSPQFKAKSNSPTKEETKEDQRPTEPQVALKAPAVACTKLCQNSHKPRICHPICLAEVYPDKQPWNKKRVYVALDAQSDASLATPEFFNMFNLHTETIEYTISTCSGKNKMNGRVATKFKISPVGQKVRYDLPDLIECSLIPRNKEQIATKEVVQAHPHLKGIQDLIPALDLETDIVMLIGADCPTLFRVSNQIEGPKGSPMAQQLPLGWTVLGPVCLNKMFQPVTKRPSLMQGCASHISVCCQGVMPDYSPIIEVTERDEQTAFSKNDQKFLEMMNSQVTQVSEANWTAPLPFKPEKPSLPNNRDVALHRLLSLRRRMLKDPKVKTQITQFVEDLFKSNDAEPASVCGGRRAVALHIHFRKSGRCDIPRNISRKVVQVILDHWTQMSSKSFLSRKHLRAQRH
ncbi:uncharacterized protein LOC134297634 [Anolis carolinensis]|uniref:uncharacterized protein LOC134297634 n=1 Tax=Anolis carolinensis TaxID=28377 RepID=UPI002F2B8D5A